MVDANDRDTGGAAEPVAATLRRAAALLRSIDRDHPRGRWRWGDPEPADEDAGTPGAVPGRGRFPAAFGHESGARWPVDPLVEFEQAVRRPGVAPPEHPRGHVVDPALAQPLADLLDALAAGAPPRADAEPYRSALHVAEGVCGSAR